MKLFYSPSFSGFVYTDSSRLMFNERLVDTAALVEDIKLHAGLSTEHKEDIERTVDYYKAMKTLLNSCKDDRNNGTRKTVTLYLL
ncbi:hypothetical protein DYE49_05960 [Treponema rectale]|uniref:Uncharacterized protein n=1 Tax=Treponema rectale TaxID=744512 RepID=A0A840SDL4_9SPIR|nr:hypothetical protein [Treponema rectale]MBB5218278.1 hypothetical protein [Treponema rectale]QOS40019.1 hypothetical protein DYE49_05960 [Treponema rectale]